MIDVVRTFSENGMLTRDRGLVVGLTDGSQFQIAIRCSRNPTPEEG